MARIRLSTTPTTTTPPANELAVYAKSDGRLYIQDDQGTESILAIGSGGGGGVSYSVEYVTIDSQQEADKEITLNATPSDATKTLVDVYNGGGMLVYSADFTVTGNVLSWSGGRFDGILAENDELRIVYPTQSGSEFSVEYFTLTSQEENDQEITLSNAPTEPTKTLVEVYNGGGMLVYSLDFTVSGSVLSWSGGRFDGLLTENDELRVVYI